MNDVDLALWNTLKQIEIPSQRWQARLNLVFESQRGRSVLARREHYGPLVIQKTLHPEGEAVCHGVIIHPPGGIAGGDALTLTSHLGEHARALLTTPGATKWYKANGATASQHLEFVLQAASCLEWLPQENILFDGSHLKLSADISLDADSIYAGWEILCFGRQAQAEQWQSGRYQQSLTIKREQRLIWQERALLHPQHHAINAMVGLHGHVVSGSYVIAAGKLPQELLAQCREIALTCNARYGITALPEIVCARYVGASAPQACEYFEQLWQLLRPWYAQRAAHRPRIWNT